jgi:hypothetical protein
MGERESQIDREVEIDSETEIDPTSDPGFDTGLGEADRTRAGQTADESADDSLGARVRSRAGSLVSPGGLIAGIVLSLLGIFLVNAIPLLGSITLSGLLGVPLGTFVHGLFGEDSRYIEAALAGGIAAGGAVLLSVLFLALFGVGTGLVGVAAVGGALGGALGHYFGRDLRNGLTRDIE